MPVRDNQTMLLRYVAPENGGRGVFTTLTYPAVIDSTFHPVNDAICFYPKHPIRPLNIFQQMEFELIMSDANLLLLFGPAGTGKSLLPLAYTVDAISRVLKNESGNPNPNHTYLFESADVLVPIVANEDLGYLPGNLEEKMDPYVRTVKEKLTFVLTGNGNLGTSQSLIPYSTIRSLKRDPRKKPTHAGKITIESVANWRGRDRYGVIVSDERRTTHLI